MKSQTYVLELEKFVNLELNEDIIQEKHDYILRNLTLFSDKIKDIENFINFMTITIFVDNININIADLSLNNIVYIEDIEKIYFLKVLDRDAIKKEFLHNKKIIVTLVSFDEELNKDYYIFDYLLKFAKYVKDGQLDLTYIETTKKFSDYVKGARKSLFSTIYGFSELKRIREERLEISCICGNKHVLKKEDLREYFYKNGNYLYYRCNEQEDSIDIESNKFVFTLKENITNSDTLLIVPKYFRNRTIKNDYIKWIFKNIRGQI